MQMWIERICIVSRIKNLEGREIYRFQMRLPIGNCKILYLTVYIGKSEVWEFCDSTSQFA